jgi:hypothetical protein
MIFDPNQTLIETPGNGFSSILASSKHYFRRCFDPPTPLKKSKKKNLTLSNTFLGCSEQIAKSELRPSDPSLPYEAVSRHLPVDTPCCLVKKIA